MPIISIGNFQTNVTDPELKELLSDINKLIKYEIVVQEIEWERGFIFKKKYIIYRAYHKTSDAEAEDLTGGLTKREMKYFLEGLYIGWKNPVRKLTIVK
ncbi:hypothetical protein [Priestia aryabhattai]|uniref:hypothetical protein n=1 Tax=Priestia aryabhattai TaxID=412384 RepID=UPI0015F72E77|nr:hypothetical protein [Priestia aryabhattai]